MLISRSNNSEIQEPRLYIQPHHSYSLKTLVTRTNAHNVKVTVNFKFPHDRLDNSKTHFDCLNLCRGAVKNLGQAIPQVVLRWGVTEARKILLRRDVFFFLFCSRHVSLCDLGETHCVVLQGMEQGPMKPLGASPSRGHPVGLILRFDKL